MKIGIIIVTHGQMAEGLKQTLFSILGEKDKVVSLSVTTESTLDSLYEKIINLVEMLNTEHVVIFTDMLGGTPCNVALKVCKTKKNVHIVSGVNLYMLISAIHLREQYENVDGFNIQEYIDKILTDGKNCIIYVNQFFKDKLNKM